MEILNFSMFKVGIVMQIATVYDYVNSMCFGTQRTKLLAAITVSNTLVDILILKERQYLR